MLFMSDRNFGCRFKEVTFNGCRSLILENDRVSSLILLDKGSDIAEFVYKKTDTDFFWRSPSGLSLLGHKYTGREPYVGGWFEAFPNAGEPCRYQDSSVQRFGDARFLPWQYTVLEDSPEKVVLRLFARSSELPLKLEKDVTIVRGEAKLRFFETVTNDSEQGWDFTWGHHPNIARPFLSGDCTVEMDSGVFHLLETDESGVTEPVRVGEWPYFTIDGKTRDARRIPAYESDEEPELSMLYLSDIGSRLRVRDNKTGLCFDMDWDASVFKGMLMCRAFLQKNWSPTFGNRYILVPFIISDHRACLTDALRHGAAIRIEPGETKTSFHSFGVSEEPV